MQKGSLRDAVVGSLLPPVFFNLWASPPCKTMSEVRAFLRTGHNHVYIHHTKMELYQTWMQRGKLLLSFARHTPAFVTGETLLVSGLVGVLLRCFSALCCPRLPLICI